MSVFNDVRFWRAVIGATWSIPLRYVTLSAQLTSIALVTGIGIDIPAGLLFYSLTAGVMTGWAIRLIDNLLNEFLVFEAIRKKFFKGSEHEQQR